MILFQKVLYEKKLIRYFAPQFINLLTIVIKKGRGNRPCEALATLYLLEKVLNSTNLDR